MADPAELTDDPGMEAGPPGARPDSDASMAARVVLAAQVGALLVLVLDVPGLVLLAVVVAATVSGYALVRHARLADPLLEVLLSPAITLSLMGLLSVAQAYTAWWQPRVTVGAMLLLGTASVALELALARTADREVIDEGAEALVAARLAAVARSEPRIVRAPGAPPAVPPELLAATVSPAGPTAMSSAEPEVRAIAPGDGAGSPAEPPAALPPGEAPEAAPVVAVVAATALAGSRSRRKKPPGADVRGGAAEPTTRTGPEAPAADPDGNATRDARLPTTTTLAGPPGPAPEPAARPKPSPRPRTAKAPAPAPPAPPRGPKAGIMAPDPRSRAIEPAPDATPESPSAPQEARGRQTRKPRRTSG